MPDKTEKKQGKFRKGHSGNPLGRPRGTRNKASIAAEVLFEGEIEGICHKAIEEAKRGNIQAIKLVLDRILPPKKEGLENEKAEDIAISENVSGDVDRIILEPMAEIPARELWLHKNRKAYESVQKGLDQAEKGKIKTLT